MPRTTRSAWPAATSSASVSSVTRACSASIPTIASRTACSAAAAAIAGAAPVPSACSAAERNAPRTPASGPRERARPVEAPPTESRCERCIVGIEAVGLERVADDRGAERREVDALAARPDRREQSVRGRAHQHDAGTSRRLFERLQQLVRRGVVESLHVEHHNDPTHGFDGTARDVGHDELRVLHPDLRRGRIDLHHVGVNAAQHEVAAPHVILGNRDRRREATRRDLDPRTARARQGDTRAPDAPRRAAGARRARACPTTRSHMLGAGSTARLMRRPSPRPHASTRSATTSVAASPSTTTQPCSAASSR